MLTSVMTLALAGQAMSPFQAEPDVKDPIRLALTPILDGVVSDGEWEFLSESSGGRAYFQWEPGRLYWAAKAPLGQDVVLTLDANADGWLVGKDNLEIRFRFENNQVRTTVRQLDATDRNGPQWIEPEIIPETLEVAASLSDGYWNLEVGFEPHLFGPLPSENRRVGARIDFLPPSSDSGPGYMPRTLSFLLFRLDTSSGLFSGMTWKPEVRNREVSRFDQLRFRLNFVLEEDCPPLSTVVFRGQGFAGRAVQGATAEFPQIDNRGRGFVDFHSPIDESAVAGYRVLEAVVRAADGRQAVIRTSFRVANLVDLDPNFRFELPYSDQPQRVRGGVTVKSQALGRVDGRFSIRYPDDWLNVGALDRTFLIYHSKGQSRIPVEFVVPGGVRGVFPVRLSAKVGESSVFRTVYVTVGR